MINLHNEIKEVSFVDPNYSQGPIEFNAYMLPYSVAILWSYVNQFDEIKKNYTLGHFIWKRYKVDECLEKLKNSSVVGFSTYIWNRNYNYKIAKELKKINPDCLIVFGGPEPPITKKEFFNQFPYIDLVVKNEGEITFKKILNNFSNNKNFNDIPGLLINQNGKTIDTENAIRIDDLDNIPSPYIEGYFDKLLKENPSVTWNAILETNRGCPYQCTFCDWGSLTYSKVKKFNLERVYAELDWIGKNRIEHTNICDANFGIFTERDSLIADIMIEVNKKYSFPKKYNISWAKNQKTAVVDIIKKLVDNESGQIGFTLSVQTLDEDVLSNIKRKNLEINKIEEIFNLCDKENIPLYTELILGLPGETVESWKNNFEKLFELGNHTGITVYQNQLLENAEMNLEQREPYKLVTKEVYDFFGSPKEDEEQNIPESIDVVISTKDLTLDQMIECQLYSCLMQNFHISGYTNIVSRFLRKKYNLMYKDFYDKFYKFILKNEFLKNEFEELKKYYRIWSQTGKVPHPKIGKVEIYVTNLIHRTNMLIHYDSKYNEMFDVIKNFVISLDIIEDKEILNNLIKWQKSYVIDFKKLKSYPIQEDFDYDIYNYIIHNKELKKEKVCYSFDFSEDKNYSIHTFCARIFHGKKTNFGKAIIKKVND